MNKNSKFNPMVIAGPCVAESWEILNEVAAAAVAICKEFGAELVFKTSFDKANRSSVNGFRGPGLAKGLEWMALVKEKYRIPVLMDVHEMNQVKPLAEVVDYIQIPAFLCRQTDLLVEAVRTGRAVNIKKGQFMAPGAMKHIVGKAKEVCEKEELPLKLLLTERGSSFGYGRLIVDMPGMAIMAENNIPIIFDATHSTQLPPTSEGAYCSGGERRFTPLLARAAAATGYIDGVFLEVHPHPAKAKSDASSQLTPVQMEALLRQVIPMLREAKELREIDHFFN